MSWWFGGLSRSTSPQSPEEKCPRNWEDEREDTFTENSSIFSQFYEFNGCYRCSLKMNGFGLEQYRCDAIFMEKKLLVLHLVSRSNLNVPKILAPLAATAFASTLKSESSGVSKGEWIVLPFENIKEVACLGQGSEIRIETSSGTRYILGENDECISKALEIFREKVGPPPGKGLRDDSGSPVGPLLYNAKGPASSLDEEAGRDSVSAMNPLENVFPGCIVSVTTLELAKILTAEGFYGEYILDPHETFELSVSKWDAQGGADSATPTDAPLRQGATRRVQYKRKISAGVVDIWVSFDERHQISFPPSHSFFHILINVSFSIFERQIGIKVLVRLVALQQARTQLDVECELENTRSLPYFVRTQLESSTINSIKSTVEKYVSGIKSHFAEQQPPPSESPSSKPDSGSPTQVSAPGPSGDLCGSLGRPDTGCDRSVICCFHPLTQALQNILNLGG
ncbi:putative low complexity protein [Cryptosporidium felis]|nr:putative low complexity protein [Cryptosporidium felis]